MGAVWMRMRTELRANWRAWISLALIAGIAAGCAIAAAAGARRSQTAYPRFLRQQDAFHAMTGGGAEQDYEEHVEKLKAMPQVADHVEATFVGGELLLPARRGKPERKVTFPDALLTADPSGRTLYETNRAKVLTGRLPDRRKLDEIAVPFTVAERHDVEVGDRLVAAIGFDDVEQVPLTVTGIYAAPFDFDAVGQTTYTTLFVTPALYERYRDRLPPLNPDTWMIFVHLKGGDAAAYAFKQEVEERFEIDVPMIEPITTTAVQKTMELYAAALWIVCAMIAAGSGAIIGQTLARQQTLDAADHTALRALGFSRSLLVALGLLRAAMIGAVAAVLAAGVAFLLSPLSPIGTARVAEPDPGYAFDATAIGIGVATTLLGIVLLAVWPSVRAAIVAAQPTATEGTHRPSRLVAAAARIGAPSMVAGLRMALERGRGRTAVPVRTTIVAVALGAAALTASMSFGRSLDHLIATPALSGYTYDAILPSEDDGVGVDAKRAAELRAMPFVEAAAAGTGLNAVFAGVDAFVVGYDYGEQIGFATIDGRAPTDALQDGVPEIALGPATMRRLKLRFGQTVEFVYASEDRERVEQKAIVVGTAAIPPLPWAATEPGEGAVMTTGAIHTFSPNDGGGCCFVRFRPGTDLDEARIKLEAAGYETFLRSERADLTTMRRLVGLPKLLSALFAGLAVAALVHVLVTAIRRRRRDLALLKTLGFVTSQVRRAIAWHASTIGLLCVLVGVPVGVILGRLGWRWVALRFGVVPVSVLPVLMLILALPVALIAANAAALLPARAAARTQPAIVLRAE